MSLLCNICHILSMMKFAADGPHPRSACTHRTCCTPVVLLRGSGLGPFLIDLHLFQKGPSFIFVFPVFAQLFEELFDVTPLLILLLLILGRQLGQLQYVTFSFGTDFTASVPRVRCFFKRRGPFIELSRNFFPLVPVDGILLLILGTLCVINC